MLSFLVAFLKFGVLTIMMMMAENCRRVFPFPYVDNNIIRVFIETDKLYSSMISGNSTNIWQQAKQKSIL